jgi:hypothetical protein
LAHRHPGGVEASLLKSAFVGELARRRERAGLPELTPARNTEGFTRTLAALARRYPPPIEQVGDLWLPTSRPKGKAAKGGGTSPAAEPADPGPDHRCRHCGEPVDWTRPGGVAFADGGSAHVRCHDDAEVARLLAAADRAVLSSAALADPGELTVRGEPLP